MNFYRQAATALDHLDKYQGSVKGSLASAKIESPAESRRVLALLIETLKYRDVLTELLKTVNLMKLEKETFRYKATPSSKNLLLVLLHDLLFSKRIEASDKWPPKPAVMRHQARLKAELVRIQIRAGKKSIRELGKDGAAVSARYVRWNPNAGAKWTLDALHKHLEELGMKKVEETYPVPEGSYFMDSHLPDCLLVFPPSSTWWVGDEWYEGGAVILQDKASCFPAKVIMDGWEEGACLDGTAAPGNKTSYMSALMGNKGVLYAFEKSEYRFRTLEKMLRKAKCSNVKTTRGDFTETNPKDYPDVTRILLDPSCSGSGIVNRLDYLVDSEEAEETGAGDQGRLEKLAAFQLQMIQHAFKFPSVTRIVYSTCSIHAEEDERVVARALANTEWKLAPRSSVLPTWERRGRPEELDGADSVIRCLPEDRTNGFFVACFERRSAEEREKFEKEEVARKVKLQMEKKQKPAKKEVEKSEVAEPAPASKAGVSTGKKAKAAPKKGDKRKLEAAVEEPSKKQRPATQNTPAKPVKQAEAAATPTTAAAAPKTATPKPKTEAQLERLRRKKKAQKARK